MGAGMFNQMWSLPTETDRQFFRRVIDDVLLAEELGYDTLWFGEHHFGRATEFYARIPITDILIATLGPLTSRIRLGSGIKQLSTCATTLGQGVDASSGTARIAEEMAMLDLATDGRVEYGLASGMTYDENGKVRPVAPAGHKEHFEQILRELAALIGAPTSADPLVTPTPQPELLDRVWIGSRTESTITLSAELGFKLIMGQAQGSGQQRDYTEWYRAGGGTGEVRGMRLVLVAETDEEAYEAVGPAAEAYYGRMRRNAASSSMEPARTVAEACERLDYYVGSPETVAAKMTEFRLEVGADRVDALMHVPGVSPDAVHRSMELFVTEVAPYVNPE